jgi:hypothetical protein
VYAFRTLSTHYKDPAAQVCVRKLQLDCVETEKPARVEYPSCVIHVHSTHRGDVDFFLSHMRVFLYPSLLNKKDVCPGTKKLFTINE